MRLLLDFKWYILKPNSKENYLEQNDHVFNLSLKFLKFVKIKNQNYTQINSLKISFFCLFIQSRTFPKHPTYLCTLMRAQWISKYSTTLSREPAWSELFYLQILHLTRSRKYQSPNKFKQEPFISMGLSLFWLFFMITFQLVGNRRWFFWNLLRLSELINFQLQWCMLNVRQAC